MSGIDPTKLYLTVGNLALNPIEAYVEPGPEETQNKIQSQALKDGRIVEFEISPDGKKLHDASSIFGAKQLLAEGETSRDGNTITEISTATDPNSANGKDRKVGSGEPPPTDSAPRTNSSPNNSKKLVAGVALATVGLGVSSMIAHFTDVFRDFKNVISLILDAGLLFSLTLGTAILLGISPSNSKPEESRGD